MRIFSIFRPGAERETEIHTNRLPYSRLQALQLGKLHDPSILQLRIQDLLAQSHEEDSPSWYLNITEALRSGQIFEAENLVADHERRLKINPYSK